MYLCLRLCESACVFVCVCVCVMFCCDLLAGLRRTLWHDVAPPQTWRLQPNPNAAKHSQDTHMLMTSRSPKKMTDVRKEEPPQYQPIFSTWVIGVSLVGHPWDHFRNHWEPVWSRSTQVRAAARLSSAENELQAAREELANLQRRWQQAAKESQDAKIDQRTLAEALLHANQAKWFFF